MKLTRSQILDAIQSGSKSVILLHDGRFTDLTRMLAAKLLDEGDYRAEESAHELVILFRAKTNPNPTPIKGL